MRHQDRKDRQETEAKPAGQAAVELAVFGAILIFIIGTIVRTAVGNSYQQNENFKAMRMALLASWKGSQAQNTAHNAASVLVVEDRLSPDSGKYGDLDRNPYIATGSGTFSYYLMYPVDQGEVSANLPIMDLYVNGQHFPLTMASYVSNKAIDRPGINGSPDCATVNGQTNAIPPAQARETCLRTCCSSSSSNQQQCPQACQQNCQLVFQAQCLLNQCLRNKTEWAGGTVKAGQFEGIIPVLTNSYPDATSRETQDHANAMEIFADLKNANLVVYASGSDINDSKGTVNFSGSESDTKWQDFVGIFTADSQNFTGQISAARQAGQNITFDAVLADIENILIAGRVSYKLFYTLVPNGVSTFSPTPPAACLASSSNPCLNQALSADLPLAGDNDQPVSYKDDNGNTVSDNSQGIMQYDLLRLRNYQAVAGQFPYAQNCSSAYDAKSMRCNIAWQWAATAGTPTSIGLDAKNNMYPSYDINGRLKEVTIYGITQNADGSPVVSYEDPMGGDIASTWDTNSCGPKPGLQSDQQVFTFTKNGTCLVIREGKMYNYYTGQYVSSANLRNTIDVVQRSIQLSNNTGRFCSSECADGGACNAEGKCADGTACGATHLCTTGCADPNPVEACVGESAPTDNCFQPDTIKETCYDVKLNKIFVRSRLEDLRGHAWLTNTAGRYQVGK